MSRVYVGNLDPRATERELEDEFRVYGVLRRFAFFPLYPIPSMVNLLAADLFTSWVFFFLVASETHFPHSHSGSPH
jgi:RNA recognition motif-containing protein